MKAKGVRIVANLILWIGILSCLLGCVLAMLLSMGNPLGLPTDYVPDMWCFITLGIILVATLVIFVILRAVAGAKEKRAAIRACWEAAEAAAAEEAACAEEACYEECCEEECCDGECCEEACEETAAEAPKSKADAVRKMILEKTPVTEDQLEKAEKIGKIALPIVVTAAAIAVVAKVGSNQKKASRRRKFYNWLG